MANTKISALPASAGLLGTDLFAVVDDPAGTPATQRATINQAVNDSALVHAAARIGVGAAADANHFLLVSAGTITTDKHVLDGAVTWNAAGVSFVGLKLNVTNTASASASLLFDVQKDGASVFHTRVDGRAILAGRFIATGPAMTLGHALKVTDALTTSTPIVLALSHTLSSGTAATGLGVSLDWNLDSSTTVETRACRWITSWTDATHASRTAITTFNSFTNGSEGVALVLGGNQVQINQGTVGAPGLANRSDLDTGIWFPTTNTISIAAGGADLFRANATQIGFFAATPVVKQTGGVATAGGTYGATEQTMLNAIYTALQNYGLLT